MKISKLKTACLALMAGSALALPIAPAAALKINLIDIGGVTGSPAAQGFAIAAKYWESVLTNNVTMNIEVGFMNLGPSVLGGTQTSLQTFVPMAQYYALLNANTTKSAIDTAAIANLRPLDVNGGVNVTVPGYFDPVAQTGASTTTKRQAPTNEAMGNTIAISNSNFKALLNNNAGATLTDANIQFSNTFAFDFDPTNGITTGTFDFIGVAIHEIGHALGFLSGAEDFDYVAGPGDYQDDDLDSAWWGYSADMFRYSAANKLDWTFGTRSYFSLDGGTTAYGDGFWSTGSNFGDGWQASHWKGPQDAQGNFICSGFRGIMNPYICNGIGDSVTGLDLALLDAIGWNVNFNVNSNLTYNFTTADAFRAFAGAIPEPMTWVQMTIGFGMIGGLLRRRRRTATQPALATV